MSKSPVAPIVVPAVGAAHVGVKLIAVATEQPSD
tara:strand:+ start:2911 stop:3012 length:102 start_codon:yes stop_codon:yes gene_type:complete